MKESFSDDDRRNSLKESTNMFRVLIKTLLHAGIITSRTAPLYAVWVDMKELEAEGDGIPGDVVAEEMLVRAARDQRQAPADQRRRTWPYRPLDLPDAAPRRAGSLAVRQELYPYCPRNRGLRRSRQASCASALSSLISSTMKR